MTKWKKMKPPFLRYSISNDGQVRNDKTDYIFTNNRRIGGYIRVSLTDGHKCQTHKLMHILVAEYFIGKKPKNKIVHHKDSNRLNNYISNLEYITSKENSVGVKGVSGNKSRAILQYDLNMNFIKKWDRIIDTPYGRSNISSACSGKLKQAYGFIWRYFEEQIDGEIWKKKIFNKKQIEISNMGRVRLSSGKITYGSKMENGYNIVNISGKSIFVHRLVLSSFCKVVNWENYTINHKDYNKTNNNLDNLEWMTQKENNQHSWQKKRKNNVRKCKVIRIDENGNKKLYKSMEEASVQNSTSKGNIWMVCNGQRKTAKGFKWGYAK